MRARDDRVGLNGWSSKARSVELFVGDGPVLAVRTLSPGTAGPHDYATVSAPVVGGPVSTTSASDCVARCGSRASPSPSEVRIDPMCTGVAVADRLGGGS